MPQERDGYGTRWGHYRDPVKVRIQRRFRHHVRSNWNPKKWYYSTTEYLDRDARHEREMAVAQSALDVATGRQRHHDAELEDAKAQVDQTIAHFEGIIGQLSREKAATDLLNKTLDESIRDLQDKENSLKFSPGCWVPLDSEQVNNTQ